MKVVYMSFDGKCFSSEEECRFHEENNPSFKMYDEAGKVTDDPNMSKVVHLFNDEESGRACADLHEEYDCSCDGIDAYSGAGWYFWGDDGWTYIPDDVVSVLKEVLR
jgi:hypothetical protein